MPRSRKGGPPDADREDWSAPIDDVEKAEMLRALTAFEPKGEEYQATCWETKKLLIGETADPHLIAGIREIVEAYEAVVHCGPPLTMHLGPEDNLLNLDVRFRKDLSGDEIFEAIDRLECAIRKRFKEVRRIFIEAERLRQDDGKPAESPRSAAGRVADGAEASPAVRTPASSSVSNTRAHSALEPIAVAPPPASPCIDGANRAPASAPNASSVASES